MTFWLRRCTEQSRTPSAHAVPWPSAMTCTSTCRAPVTRRSRNTTPLPKARAASSRVRSNASVSSWSEVTTRMPRPPPPAGRLLDDLLVASLYRAVAHAERPRRSLAIGNDLHLNVPGASDKTLEKHHSVAEGARGLVTSTFERVGQLVVGGDHSNAATAATGRRLEHQRVADLARSSQRRLDVVN